ncbi:hypothetical protein [Stenotrophomonas maltophilia]|uniref:hypothetical protein n=1 Tax=Stenotrophomonas maltophilia TaxID=40324 RepID=UPI0039C0D8E3
MSIDTENDLPRYVVLKASGSRFAYVNDTHERRTVTRWDILKSNGWDKAELQCKRLNEEHERGRTNG